MRCFWSFLVLAVFLPAVGVAVMATPKRPAPPKPELVTIEFNFGEYKFTVTGTPVEHFDNQPQEVNRIIKADLEVH